MISFNYVKFSEVASLLPGDIMVHSLSELTNAAHNMRNALINIWKTRV